MILILRHIKRSVQPAIAAILTVWLSGAAFLFCCAKVNASTGQKDSCPMARMSSHCHRARGESLPSLSVGPIGQTAGCAYLPVVFDKYRKFENTQTELAQPGPVASIRFAPPVFKIVSFSLPLNQRISYEAKLLAKNCILRI